MKKYDPSVSPYALRVIINHLSMHCNLAPSRFNIEFHFCHNGKISPSTYRRWVKKYPEFAEQLEGIEE